MSPGNRISPHDARLLVVAGGTRKSLRAELRAEGLDVDLLTVDIGQVVSKWIGETEKNLSAVFDAAERSGAVLVLDEADALFGKRTETHDSHDRYVDLETGALVKRLEMYPGIPALILRTARRPLHLPNGARVIYLDEGDRE